MLRLRCVQRFPRPQYKGPVAPIWSVRRGLASLKPQSSLFAPLDTFHERHIGPDDAETNTMLRKLGYESMDAFIAATVPPKIRIPSSTVSNESIPVLSESQLQAQAKALGGQNQTFKSYIGMGYHNAVIPPVILRNVCGPLYRPIGSDLNHSQ